MATYVRSIRQGLPRWPGGEPWPPAGDAPVAELIAVAPEQPREMVADAAVTVPAPTPEAATGPSEMAPATVTPIVAEPVAPAAPARGLQSIRRGLPRVPGGEPWPPAGTVAASVAAVPVASPMSTPDAGPTTAAQAAVAAQAPVAAEVPVVPARPAAGIPVAAASDRPLRRGLPRVKDGEPWPPAGFAPARVAPAAQVAPAAPDEIAPAVAATAPAPAAAATAPAPAAAASVPAPVATAGRPVRAPLARPTTPARPVPPARPRPASVPAQKPGRFGAYTRGQLLGFAVIGGFALMFAAMVAVVAAAWIRALPVTQDFLTAFPGEYHLPETATPGFPAWVQWQHFFNVFLMVLIIRSGLQVRTEKRPGAYWTPRWSKDGKGKISLGLWFHQSLDILWLLNGVIFVALLFASGHWMRIVPTSWEVFPNALSAMLQYASLNWPTENGWVNYNSLQQIMYFLTVFVAAPLAAITGVRMSGMWPKNAKTLNRIYPVEWARAIHFPVMLYFVAFIIIHVALVFATGALRNLNHMYGGTDVVNWAGFWIFFVSLLIIVGGWIAARPLVLAPIAKLTGKVTAR
ncbi:cytochrome b/b6 domain-containing protein [Salinibacterium sp. ZJ450]|uniref:cytochrome b/b6 domain-containing protein n=1 Tax=Salinibacterium sp. ZJ450 TaxID=2708338 RepID=UPI00141E6BE9|nr:cytochrome b/b6 domain-containing protein [Salinibacterium sp. ZJ450]